MAYLNYTMGLHGGHTLNVHIQQKHVTCEAFLVRRHISKFQSLKIWFWKPSVGHINGVKDQVTHWTKIDISLENPGKRGIYAVRAECE